MTGSRQCENCGFALEPDWQFCENCGSPVPAGPPPNVEPVILASTAPAAPPVQSQAGGSKLPRRVLVGGAGLLFAVCACIALAGGYYLLRNRNAAAEPAAPTLVAGITEAATRSPVALSTTQEAATLPPVDKPEITPSDSPQAPPSESPTALPVETQLPEPATETAPPPSATPEVFSVQQNFTRWAFDYSLGWEVGQDEVAITDISQNQNWLLGLTQSESIVIVIPPDPQAFNTGGVNFSLKIKPGDPETAGPYGLICDLQDENNYYVAEIWGDSFGIGKMKDGVFTPLTDPYWQTSQFIGQVGSLGFAEVGISCFDYSIGLEINGLAETFPVYDPEESFSGGAVALFGASSQEAVDMLMGMFYIKNLRIETLD